MAWQTNINFIARMRLILLSSLVMCIVSVVALGSRGLHFGTDFSGGFEIQVRFSEAVSETAVRNALSPLGLEDARVQRFGDEQEHTYLILLSRLQSSGSNDAAANLEPDRQLAELVTKATAKLSPQVTVERVDFVGPQIGEQLRNRGILAVVYALFFILLYIALRFDFYFSPGAIVATLHDILVVLLVFSLFQVEFNLTVVAALLTLIGFSLNDTIVVYDRIRENLRKSPHEPLRALVNRSINETLSRTVLTSGTVLLVVTALLLFGGPYIFGFALTMFVGVIVGTYSSIAVASPVYIALCEYFGKSPGEATKRMGATQPLHGG